MKRIFLLVLIFAVVSTGIVFAQEDDDDDMPKNAITVDFGPTLLGLSFGGASSMMEGVGKLFKLNMNMGNFKTSGFGIGVQYERSINEKLSVAGRFAYLQMGFGLGLGDNIGVGIDISSFSIEGHFRYFFDKSMFFDGMLGYANMTAAFKGSVDLDTNDPYGYAPNSVDVNFKVPRDYFKLGVKLGWKIDFGEPGGFIFEPSVGWSFGIGTGDTIVKKTSQEVDNKLKSLTGGAISGKSSISQSTEKMLGYVESAIDNLIFVGGPRLSLAVGWSF